jgi:hypothetical protein
MHFLCQEFCMSCQSGLALQILNLTNYAEYKISLLKLIQNLPALTPTINLYSIDNPSLHAISQFQSIFFIFKLKHNLIYGNFDLIEVNRVHAYPTRQVNDFYITTSSTNRGRDNVLNKGLTRFNHLPPVLKQETTISGFKLKLLRHLYLVD